MNPETADLPKQAAGMAWAAHATDGRPVYIGKLPRSQTGLACRCVCPACGATLAAVNAGVQRQLQAAGSLTPHFRHHNAAQHPGCLTQMAQLVTLEQILQQGYIEVPGPTRTARAVGASGTLYPGHATGQATRHDITSVARISTTSAHLTLADGRTVLITLHGVQQVSEIGPVSAHIEIRVSDPQVAMLSPDEILERARLNPNVLCVQSHWQDSEIQAEADEDARKHALEALDPESSMLALPPGATAQQRAEGALHLLIKQQLTVLQQLNTPELPVDEEVFDQNGTRHTRREWLPARMLQISNVRQEVHAGDYRPDIVCTAHAPPGLDGKMPAPFDLLVEVAVTHKVDHTKLSKIARDGRAALEINVHDLWTKGGRISINDVRTILRDNLSAKEWLVHPDTLQLQAAIREKLTTAIEYREQKEEAARLLALQQERLAKDRRDSRTSWLQSLPEHEVLREYRHVLEARSSHGVDSTSDGTVWPDGEFEKASLFTLPTGWVRQAATLLSKVLKHAPSPESPGGPAIPSQHGPLSPNAVPGLTPHAFDIHPGVGLLHLVIRDLQIPIHDDEAARFADAQAPILVSLHRAERTYARPAGHDEVLSAMFPEIVHVLARPIGTLAYSDRVELAKARQQALDDELRKQKLLQEEAEKAAAQERAADERARRELHQALTMLPHQMTWRQGTWEPKTVAKLHGYLRLNRSPELGWPFAERALAARLAGKSFAEWLGLEMLDSPEAIGMVSKALEDSGLVVPKSR